MQRLKKTHSIREAEEILHKLKIPKTKIFQCGLCKKIMCVSNKGVHGATRGDGHHDHLHRCKSNCYIQRWDGYMSISGYNIPNRWFFWLWKL